jgi:hypothetical protein
VLRELASCVRRNVPQSSDPHRFRAEKSEIADRALFAGRAGDALRTDPRRAGKSKTEEPEIINAEHVAAAPFHDR